MPRPSIFNGFPDALRGVYGPYSGVADEVHDGDTVKVICDTGLDQVATVWIRLVEEDGTGVYAPESWQPGGREATEELRRLLGEKPFVRVTTVKMTKTHDEKMTFARYLGSLELPDGRDAGEEMNRWLTDNGYKR